MARYDNKVDVIETVIRDVCDVAVEPDGLIFDVATVVGWKIKEDADYEGVRIKFMGFLDRARIPMQIDIGFGDVVFPKVRKIDYPAILDFPNPHLKGYPQESVVSEKFEAMIKLGLLNSRMKDFYDIWLMMRMFEFKGADLIEAIMRTFKHRKTEIPKNKPLFADDIFNVHSDRQTLWISFVRKGNIQHVSDTLSTVAKEIEYFLIEPITAINRNKEFRKVWKPLKGWRE